MASIKVDSRKMNDVASEYASLMSEVNGMLVSVIAISKKLDTRIKSRNRISTNFDSNIDKLKNIKSGIQKLSSLINESSSLMMQVELKNAELKDSPALKNSSSVTSQTPAASIYSSVSDKVKNFVDDPTGAKKIALATSIVASIDGGKNADAKKWLNAKKNTGADLSKIEIGFQRKDSYAPQETIGAALIASTKAQDTGIINKAKNFITSKATLAEEKIKDSAPDIATKAGEGIALTAVSSLFGKAFVKGADILNLKESSYSTNMQNTTSFLNVGSNKVDGSLITSTYAGIGETNIQAEAKAVFDPAGGNIGASASAALEAIGAKAKASVIGKFGTASAEAIAGYAGLTASASATAMKNGNFVPALKADAKAELSTLKANVHAQATSDGYSAGVNAAGSVASAKALANLNLDPAAGVLKATANAMAAAAEGTARVSADIGPIKGAVSVTGYAGAAGVKASAALEKGVLKFEAGAALGVGAGVGFEIGVGNWVEKADKVFNGVVSNGVSAVSAVIESAGSAVTGVIQSGKAAFEGIKGVGEGIIQGKPIAVAKAIGSTVVNVGKAIGNSVVGVGKGVAKVATSLAKGISGVGKTIANFFKRL